MRKSLLMTSALGLMTLLPAFAMANAAAGSSAAACGSGFFAQIDAKIMNAKLEIKNENKKPSAVADNKETDADKIAAAAAEDVISQLKKAGIEVLFDYGGGAGTNKFALLRVLFDDVNGVQLGAIRGKTPAEIATEISRVISGIAVGGPGIPPVGTAPEKKIALTLLGRELLTAAATDPEAAKAFDSLVSDIKTLADSVDPVIKTGVLNVALKQTYTFSGRGPAAAAAAVAQSLVGISGAIPNGTMANGYYRPNMGGKIYVANFGTTGDLNAAYLKDLRTAIDAQLDVKAVVSDELKKSVSILEFAKISADKNVEVNAGYEKERELQKKLDNTDRRVHHHALAGGVGATVGWWQNLGGFALSISGSGDYHWGTFRTVDDASGTSSNNSNKRRLGFGFQGDLGAHYVVSPSTTLGLLIGVRGQQLNFGLLSKTGNTDSKGDYASKWMINPVVSVQARTFFTDNVYGALTLGYIIPAGEKDYKLKNTNVPNEEAKIRLQGLTGAFSIGMAF